MGITFFVDSWIWMMDVFWYYRCQKNKIPVHQTATMWDDERKKNDEQPNFRRIHKLKSKSNYYFPFFLPSVDWLHQFKKGESLETRVGMRDQFHWNKFHEFVVRLFGEPLHNNTQKKVCVLCVGLDVRPISTLCDDSAELRCVFVYP